MKNLEQLNLETDRTHHLQQDATNCAMQAKYSVEKAWLFARSSTSTFFQIVAATSGEMGVKHGLFATCAASSLFPLMHTLSSIFKHTRC